MTDNVFTQRDFSGGELSPKAKRRDDVELHRASARTMRNFLPQPEGGISRRPGTEALFYAGGVTFKVRPIPGVEHRITLTGATFTARRVSDNDTVSTIATCPWNAGQVTSLVWDSADRQVWVVHKDGLFKPQIFTYDPAAGTWSRADFAFAATQAGRLRQPYRRFVADGVTMRANGRTGSVTLTFSAATLVAGHVGARFRYAGRELLITAVTSSTVATATCIESLPATFSYILEETEGFLLGEAVQTVNSKHEGEIVAINFTTNTMSILQTTNYEVIASTDTIVGPNQRTKRASSTAATIQTPGNSVQWEEAFMSPLRGWPGSITFDRSRAIFSRFPQLKNAICWSAIGNYTDFEVGSDADAGMFETVPGDPQIYHVMGGADEFVFSDKGVSHIPISGASPLAPGSIEFRPISSAGCADVRPLQTDEGHVFVGGGGSQINAIVATGQVSQPYIVQDLTEWHNHLVKSPIALAATVASSSMPHRYLYVVNGDGSMIVARYNQRAEWVGWVPWDVAGTVRHATGLLDDLTLSTTRAIGSGTIDGVERLNASFLLDGCRVLNGPAPGLNLAGANVHLFRGARYLGAYVVNGDGALTGATTQAGDYCGYNFTPSYAPWSPNIGEGESAKQRLKRRRISQMAVTVERSNSFRFAKRLIPPFNEGENEDLAAPRRSKTYRFRLLGRSYDVEVDLVQEKPGHLSILEVAMEVTL